MLRSRSGMTFVGVIVVLAIIGLVVALLLPARRGSREATHRNDSLNNVKQIVLAMHNYHDVHGSFPPAYTVDEDGNKLHSWRTLILPYMEYPALYEKIDLTKPWDHEVNAEARSIVIDAYQCISIDFDGSETTYLAVVGPGFAFDENREISFGDISDGSNQTVLVVEFPAEHAVHWMSPEDADEDMLLSLIEESQTHHTGGIFLVGFADGHVEPMAIDTPVETRKAMLTIAGGEEIPVY